MNDFLQAIASELQTRDYGDVDINRNRIITTHTTTIRLKDSKLYVFIDGVADEPDPIQIDLIDPNALDQLFALIPTQPGT